MIEITVFSKCDIDMILFQYEYSSELDDILSLEGKTLRDFEKRDGRIIAQLQKEIEK